MRCYLKRTVWFSLLVMALFMFANTILDMYRPETTPVHMSQGYLYQGQIPLLHQIKQRDSGYQLGDTGRGALTIQKDPHVWPKGRDEQDDRVQAQLTYIPRSIRSNRSSNRTTKVILVYTGLGQLRRGPSVFHKDQCPVRDCKLIGDRKKGPTVDAVLWQQSISLPAWKKPASQIWIMYMLESPAHTSHLRHFYGLINWTATYRRDSTIVTPYERFVPYSLDKLKAIRAKQSAQNVRNYAAPKTKKVAWFVSNCGAGNGRMAYAKELQKYIEVDIYGDCGPLVCPRHAKGEPCYDMLNKKYKFYLAFENSNCKDYITEKLYWNALLNDIVPIVMGARPLDYALSAPPHSYIHVDDFKSPKHLAEYLHTLDQDDDQYNAYFRWKGTGEFINTKFWCRLCAMLHDNTRNSWYTDINEWWHGKDTCVNPHGDVKYATWRGNQETSGKEDVVKKQNEPEPLKYSPWNSASGFVLPPKWLTGKRIMGTTIGLDNYLGNDMPATAKVQVEAHTKYFAHNALPEIGNATAYPNRFTKNFMGKR